MITTSQIEAAKRRLGLKEPFHEHEDWILIAYEWLDAQQKLTNPRNTTAPIKHYIERWAGRYVSQHDVDVAAEIHPEIKGKYPAYNISARLTEPSRKRLSKIGQAFTQNQHEKHDPKNYKLHED